MDNNDAIVILPEGSEVPEEVKDRAQIVGFVRDDGSILFNKGDETIEFDNMSKFFKYVGNKK